MFIINFYLNMIQASLCPSSVEQRTCYCIWCIVLVLLDVVGSGCGGAVLKEVSTMWVSVRLSLHTLLTMHGHRNLNIRHLHTDLVAWMTRCLGFVRLWCKPCLIIEKHNFLYFVFIQHWTCHFEGSHASQYYCFTGPCWQVIFFAKLLTRVA